CGREKEADSLAARLDKAITDLGAITRRSKSRRRVFFCVWPQPLLTIGKSSFLNHAVTICGGTNIASSLNTPYPHFTIEKLLLADPDVVILPHEARGQKMLKRFPWTALRASKTKRLYFLPPASEDALSRPTPRIIDGLYWLSQRIHPELEAELKNWRAQWKAPDTDQERGG
ncbi:MAG TPA: helical backbone metal receptor, partial [Candidatus Obscuribacterales bacterium]